MKENRKVLSIYMDESTYFTLRKISYNKNLSMTAYVEKLVKEDLAQEEPFYNLSYVAERPKA